MKAWNKLTNYLKLYFRSLAFVFASSPRTVAYLLVAIPLQALLPSVTIYLTNEIINGLSSKQVALYLLLLWALAFLLSNLVSPFITLIQGKLTDQLTYRINYDLMQQSKRLTRISYFEDHDFYNDIEFLSQEAAWRPVNLLVFGTSILSNFILFISMLGLFASFHPLIALALLLAILPHALLSYKIQQEAFEVLVSNSEQSRKLDYYSSRLLTAEAIKEVQLFNLYDFFIGKYQTTFTSILSKIQGSRKKRFLLSSLFLLLTTTLSLLSFLFVIGQILGGRLELGAVLIFSSSSLYAMTAMSRLVEESSLLYDTLLYMDKFFIFTQMEPDLAGGKSLTGHFQGLSFDNLRFAYPNKEEEVLKGISFDIQKGDKIALVGENGAGKSTLVKLILGFYSYEDGSIRLNNQELNSLDPRSYRKNFSAVFQDFAHFDLSLKENILFSDLAGEGDLDRLKKSIVAAGLESSWLEDLDQVLGKRFDDSRDLSGGQWQKLALARAFFSQADFLILDEPTAALDARTEYQLYQKFLDLTRGKTVLYITHRLSSVKQADKVLVLKDGQIEAFGPHEELMQKSPYYKELYLMQASLYQEG